MMKTYIKNIKNLRLVGLAVLVLIFVSQQIGLAQDNSEQEEETVAKIKPRIKLSTVKAADESRTVIGLFTYRNKKTKKFETVKGIEIDFYVGNDSLIKLGSFKTNENGEAVCKLSPDINLPRNEEGYIQFTAEFKGNKLFKSAGRDMEIIDLQLNMSVKEIDSVRTVIVKAEKILADDQRVPVNEEKIPIYVQRMFSQLKIGEIEIEEGEGSFEFPNDIPGDTLGLVTVIAKFDDHDDFAYISKSKDIAWGVVTSHHEIYHPRSLWTQVAPVWMIITLSVMLLGVWGHYIFVIVEMIKLKRGNKEVV